MATKESSSRGAFDLAQMIDHTLLKPEATAEQIRQHCLVAAEHRFFSVCINPGFVAMAKELLVDSPVKICTVVGFPLGANETQVKAFETACALQQGADEIDMVINIGGVKSRATDLVLSDIRAVVNAAQGRTVKVILETCLLTDEEKIWACQLSQQAEAHFVKTSTGFSSAGATIDDVRLMRNAVGQNMGVKASGGIRTHEDAKRMIAAGANRLGTSQSLQIINFSSVPESPTDY